MTTKTRYFRKPLALLVCAALAAGVMMVVLASPAQAAILTVNSTADADDGACTSDSGGCTLREAINAANSSSGEDTITFELGPSATITLASTLGQLPPITDADGLTIDGEDAEITVSGGGSVRVFFVDTGATLDLRNLTVAGGNASGSTGFDGAGGGILNASTLTVTNSTFSGNSATNVGGGIYNDSAGTLKVFDSIFSDNKTTDQSGNNLGGGIANLGTLEVSDSTFSKNSALQGGGITNFSSTTPPATVTNSTFSGNSASNGGGILNSGTLEVTNSTFSGNSAEFFGGGVYNNSAATLTVTNSTFSGNSASDEFFGGGGLFNNSDAPPPGSAVITLSNTIVANSPSGGNCGGTITDDGGNLVWPDASCPGLSANPLLGPLADNGGPTQTHALQPGSAAIDAAVNCPPPTTDQRGVSRPQGSACDIGSFELQSQPALSINDITLTEGNSGTTAATFTVSLSEASAQTVTVNYATADGRATAGTDYQSSSGTLTFAPGQTAQTVTVQVNGDTESEDNETFFVNLGTATNATISDAQGIGTVTNDDPPPNLPTRKDQCKKGGWKEFGYPDQGTCISDVNRRNRQ